MNTSASAAITLQGVSKRYRFFSMDGLSLQLEPGQIMGLVGPAGAGKSTLLRLIMGMTRADAGSIRVLGHPVPQAQALAKRNVGFVSQDMGLFASATLGWHMNFVARMHAGWDADYARELLARFNLHAAQACRGLSSGERIKALLLLALARRPRLLVLDEPTTGLDPVARHEVLAELMTVLADEHRAILFSSHYTQDVERIADRICFLDHGRIIADDDTQRFLDRWRRVQLELPEGAPLPALPGTLEVTRSGRSATLLSSAWTADLEHGLVQGEARIHGVQRLSLEEIFVASVMHARKERRS
jgi:ABC-2 type transport system ATP-binding protein